MRRLGTLIFVSLLLLVVVPAAGVAGDLGLKTDWSTGPEELGDEVEAATGSNWSDFRLHVRRVALQDEPWTQFFLFRDGQLIAEGYERVERPRVPRVGTISDVVSYDNEYPMADALRARYGAPVFKDVRTRREFSREMGDPALRIQRATEWDLLGERFRWEYENSIVRYSVRFSLDGLRTHRVVRVKDGAVDDYVDYFIANAFKEAGIELVQRFERRSEKMVVAMATSSGETVKMEVETGGEELVPVEPKHRRFTRSNCRMEGHPCQVTFSTYGGRIYKAVIDLSSDGTIGRRERGALEKAGERAYDRFLYANERLERIFGEPASSTLVPEKELTDDRKLMKVHRIPQGMSAFWSAWYAPKNDVLVRHAIFGDGSGTSYQITHRITLRLHSVTRAFAERDAWKREARQAERAQEKEEEEAEEAGGSQKSENPDVEKVDPEDIEEADEEEE